MIITETNRKFKVPEGLRGTFKKLKKLNVKYSIYGDKASKPPVLRVRCPYGDVFITSNASYGRQLFFLQELKRYGIDLRQMLVCGEAYHYEVA